MTIETERAVPLLAARDLVLLPGMLESVLMERREEEI
jgi:hypothetical protein